MFGELDHIGLFVRDLDAAVAEAREVFGLPVARETTLTQYGIEAVFLGEGSGTLELFTSVDAAALEERLDGRDRGVEVADEEADVIEFSEHRPRSYATPGVLAGPPPPRPTRVRKT